MNKKEKFFDITMIKFLIVGAINTLVGSGAMFLLYNLAHLEKWICIAANYLIGGIVSFFLNKYFTFQNRERSWAQVGRFALTVAACALIGYGAAEPLARFPLRNFSVTVQENISMLVGMVFYTGLNYVAQRFFAFKPSKGRSE